MHNNMGLVHVFDKMGIGYFNLWMGKVHLRFSGLRQPLKNKTKTINKKGYT